MTLHSTSNATLPEMEHVGLLLARLYPKRADLDSSPHRSHPGHVIAGAIGLYAQARPMRRFPAMLLMLRCWPDGLSVASHHLLLATTTAVLARRLPHQVPRRARLTLNALATSPAIAAELLAEFSAPAPCWKCQGRGEVIQNRVVVTCPQCSGSSEGPRGTPTRAHHVGVTRATWCTYLQQPYERTLHGYRFMADHAAAGVLAKLA